MCGILGLIKNNGNINSDNFKKLNDLQSHRGPDASGQWISNNGNIALGHRRLSIIDLNQGAQPMLSHDKSLIITFNGEIYNYIDLKKELSDIGHKFRTNSDTEVILMAYREWGEACVNKFRGMFAFGIVDLNKKEIFLARDPFGIKPLVYYQDKNLFCFASEINTVAQIENLDLKIDYNSIDYYLYLQYIPDPLTIYDKVKKLEPAHLMKVDFSGKIISKKRYWKPQFNPKYSKSESVWFNEFEEIMRDSIKAHTVSDVSLGSFLSGGVDSTLVTKYLSEIKKDLNTFSIGFEEKEYNELDYSYVAAKKIGSSHFTKVVTPDFFSILGKIVKHYGEPFGDSSAIPTYYVSKLAKKSVKVVLSGDGGDELFGGYNSYLAWQEKINKKNSRPFLKNVLRSVLSIFRPKQFLPEKPNLECWLGISQYFNYYQRKHLWKDEFQDSINKNYKYFTEYNKDFKNNSLVNKAQLYDLTNYLPFDILRKVDIASMMNGLEVRVPFLDKKVAEFALSMPEEINVSNSKWEGKRLLKKALENDFSDSYIYRQKQGFAVPLDKWFQSKGDLYSEPYRRLINSESKIFTEIFNLDAVYNFISSGDYSKTYFLLFLEEWFRQYENRKDLIKI
jgi:asparagine synthase (glutamine-hydrolysing)